MAMALSPDRQTLLIVSDGTLDESAIYTREIVGKAMAIGAAAIILVHNHPSGSPQPSRR